MNLMYFGLILFVIRLVSEKAVNYSTFEATGAHISLSSSSVRAGGVTKSGKFSPENFRRGNFRANC